LIRQILFTLGGEKQDSIHGMSGDSLQMDKGLAVMLEKTFLVSVTAWPSG